MARTTLRAKGQLTLPDEIRKAAHLEEGDLLEAELTADGILLGPQKLFDATPPWFWSAEWQAGERAADADRVAARGEVFASGDDLVAALRSRISDQPRARATWVQHRGAPGDGVLLRGPGPAAVRASARPWPATASG
ncbi:MAG TPA: AbrB/MazE/SpoVT family DNA-binding domain-containing protein [Acidimicrobiales bacterium]|jgi:AbrB family looped-hinge helix DNA binding protein|nr:AbrB/MazE/SpoVT family DNA-binding domain-containing protein [Acidimicrobiales bacterium]